MKEARGHQQTSFIYLKKGPQYFSSMVISQTWIILHESALFLVHSVPRGGKNLFWLKRKFLKTFFFVSHVLLVIF